MLRAVTVCMWTIAMVITVVYCGQLVATLSTNVARLPFKTLQEFADQDEIIPFVSKGISSHSMWLVNITLCDFKNTVNHFIFANCEFGPFKNSSMQKF